MNEMSKRPNPLSLEDLEIRYRNIRKSNPKIKNCSVKGCPNPRDSTPLLGKDTCCAYHRLLFDFWSSDVVPNILTLTKGQRREGFSSWLSATGQAELEKMVLRMMKEPINWEC